jgi:hypothetical protein
MFPEKEEGTGKLFGFHHETRATKHFVNTIMDDFNTNYPYDEVMYNHIHRWGSFVTGDGRGGTITASPKNTDHKGEQSAYGHSTWGSITKWTNAAPESDPASEFDWHAWHYAGPQTIIDSTEFNGNMVFEELDRIEERVPEVDIAPEDIEVPEREVPGPEPEKPEVPKGAELYANIGGVEVTGERDEETIDRMINFLEAEKASI